MSPGQIVMLVVTEEYMPPYGAIGEIITGLDHDDDYEIEFFQYPCPVPPGTSWYAHKTWVVPVVAATKVNQTATNLQLEI